MTVSGALRILGPFCALAWRASLCLPSADVTQTNRAGEQLAEVGPNLVSS